MHLLTVFAVVVGIAAVMVSVEVCRRAVLGRRMERSIEELRFSGLELRPVAGLGQGASIPDAPALEYPAYAPAGRRAS
jgi:hypothetical protein